MAYNQENDCYLKSEEACWCVTKDISKARTGTRKKLISVITTHGKMLSGEWTLIPVRQGSGGKPVPICSIQDVNPSNTPPKVQTQCESDDLPIVTGTWTCVDSCHDILAALDTFASTINTSRMDRLSNDLSEVDKELSDIYHFIEFSTLNASNGYKAYKLLQNVLIKRRNIKNEYSVIQSILSSKGMDISKREMQRKLECGMSKSYNPRVLNELFRQEGGI